jgi:hypothetical protein
MGDIMAYVEICDNQGNPITILIMQGIFPTIQQAITVVETLNPNTNYTLYLKQEENIGTPLNSIVFDECVNIPENMRNIEFRSINATIRAVKLLPGSSIKIDDNIRINNLINGMQTSLIQGSKIQYHQNQPLRSPKLEKLHKNIHSEILAAALIQEYIQKAQHYITPLSHLFWCVRKVTSNFQVLLFLFQVEEYINLVKMKLNELDIITSTDEFTSQFKKVTNEAYFHELLDNMDFNRKELKIANKKAYQFIIDLQSADHPSTAGSAMGYRNFLANFLGIVGGDILIQRQLLEKIMGNDMVMASMNMVHLKQIDDLLTEAQILLDQSTYYVYRVEDPTVLMDGENSSELLLNIAEEALKGPRASIFREALIVFLNEKCPDKIVDGMVMKNSELMARLREYTSKCPDADYFFTRFIKNHPEALLGLSLTSTSLGLMGTITSTTIAILRALGVIGK